MGHAGRRRTRNHRHTTELDSLGVELVPLIFGPALVVLFCFVFFFLLAVSPTIIAADEPSERGPERRDLCFQHFEPLVFVSFLSRVLWASSFMVIEMDIQ